MNDLADKDREYEEKYEETLKELQERHAAEVAEYEEKVEQLQQGENLLSGSSVFRNNCFESLKPCLVCCLRAVSLILVK